MYYTKESWQLRSGRSFTEEVFGINISTTEGANMTEIHVLAARLDESGDLVTARRIYDSYRFYCVITRTFTRGVATEF
jgi:hypothetical protein